MITCQSCFKTKIFLSDYQPPRFENDERLKALILFRNKSTDVMEELVIKVLQQISKMLIDSQAAVDTQLVKVFI
jgi:hypothetical protein